MKQSTKEAAVEYAKDIVLLFIIGFVFACGMRAGQHLIDAPEGHVLVCMADDVGGGAECAKLAGIRKLAK